MRNGLQCGEEDQHVVAGEGPGRDVGHRAEDHIVAEEVHLDADGGKSLNDRGNLAVVEVHPDDGCDHARNGVRQEVAQTECGDVLDDIGIDEHCQSKCRDDHDRHLNHGVEHYPAHASPEVAGSNNVLEVLKSDELIDQFPAAVCATARGDLAEEAGINSPNDGKNKYQSEQDAKRCHEGPAGTILTLHSIRSLWLIGTPGDPRLRRFCCCSHRETCLSKEQ